MEKRLLLLLVAFFLFAFTSSMQAQNTEGKKYTIYPNPAVDYLYISLSPEISTPSEIRIIDLTGKLVKKYDGQILQKQENSRIEMDISDLKSGIYFVKVVQRGKAFTEKLVVR